MLYAGRGTPEADDDPLWPIQIEDDDEDDSWAHNFRASAMGIETFKQFCACANLIQSWQQGLLTGDLTTPSITTDPNVKRVGCYDVCLCSCITRSSHAFSLAIDLQDMKLRKRSENHRRAQCFEDAAAGKSGLLLTSNAIISGAWRPC